MKRLLLVNLVTLVFALPFGLLGFQKGMKNRAPAPQLIDPRIAALEERTETARSLAQREQDSAKASFDAASELKKEHELKLRAQKKTTPPPMLTPGVLELGPPQYKVLFSRDANLAVYSWRVKATNTGETPKGTDIRFVFRDASGKPITRLAGSITVAGGESSYIRGLAELQVHEYRRISKATVHNCAEKGECEEDRLGPLRAAW